VLLGHAWLRCALRPLELDPAAFGANPGFVHAALGPRKPASRGGRVLAGHAVVGRHVDGCGCSSARVAEPSVPDVGALFGFPRGALLSDPEERVTEAVEDARIVGRLYARRLEVSLGIRPLAARECLLARLDHCLEGHAHMLAPNRTRDRENARRH
jgi:hypothetical protein